MIKNSFLLVFLLLLLLPIFISDPVILHILIYTFFMAYFALSWNILYSVGQISLGHAAFFGIGGYITVILFNYYGITPLLGIVISGTIAGMLGALVGFICFRLRGIYFSLSTLALAEILKILFTNSSFVGGATGLTLVLPSQFNSKIPHYYVMLLLLVFLILFFRKIFNSRLGFYFTAIGEDEIAAKTLGVDVFKLKVIASSISSFFTGILGSFYVIYTRFIHPESAFGIWRSCDPLVISIIGGKGIAGAILGSVAITPLTETLIILFGGELATVKMVVYGLMLMFMILLFPGGISQQLAKRFKFNFQGNV